MKEFSLRVHRCTQGFVPRNHGVQGVSQGVHFQFAAQVHAEGFVERAGRVIAELRRKKNFLLWLGHPRFAWRCYRLRGDRFPRQRQKVRFLHFVNRFFKRADDFLDVRVAVFRRQEAREVFQQVNALFAKAVVEEASEAEVDWETEVEETREILNVCRNMILFQQRVQPLDHFSSPRREIFLQLRPLRLQVRQHRKTRSHRQRVSHKRSGKEGDANGRIRIVSELPHTSVKRVHVLGFTREDTDRHSARQHFSVRREVCSNAKQFLAAARMHAETGHYFVKNQATAGILRNLPQFFQEAHRLKIWVTTLYRLNHYCCKIIRVLADPFQRIRCPILQDDDVCRLLARNSWRHRNRVRFACFLQSFHEHFVKHAVIVSSKEHDFVPARYGSRNAHRCRHCFRPGVAERRALISGKLANQLRRFTREQSLRPNLKPFMQLLFDCFLNKVRAMSQHDRSEAIQDVDVLVAVYIPETRTLGLVCDDRIDHLFPLRTEARHDTRVGQYTAIFLRHLLRGRCFLGIARSQISDVLFLPRC